LSSTPPQSNPRLWLLDRGRGVARIEPPGDPTAGGQPLTFHDGVPLIAATFDGQPATALLDTGDASVVSLGYVLLNRLNIFFQTHSKRQFAC